MFWKRKVKAEESLPDGEAVYLPSLPVSDGEPTPGWWRLEIIWPDRGKQFEFFVSLGQAKARQEQLTAHNLTTYLSCALPTITWRLVDEPSQDLCRAARVHQYEELTCCLPADHVEHQLHRLHWAPHYSGIHIAWE